MNDWVGICQNIPQSVTHTLREGDSGRQSHIPMTERLPPYRLAWGIFALDARPDRLCIMESFAASENNVLKPGVAEKPIIEFSTGTPWNPVEMHAAIDSFEQDTLFVSFLVPRVAFTCANSRWEYVWTRKDDWYIWIRYI